MTLTDEQIIKQTPKKCFFEYEQAKKSKKVNFYDFWAMKDYAKRNKLVHLAKMDWDHYMDMVAGYKVLMKYYKLKWWFDDRCDEKIRKSKKLEVV